MPLNACVRIVAPASNAASARVEVGARVPDRDAHAGVGEAPDRLGGALVLGRDRDLAEGAARRGKEPIDGCLVGTAEERRVVRPAELGIEERPLEVRAEHPRVLGGEPRDRLQLRHEPVDARGDEGEHRAGRAVGVVHGERALDGAGAFVDGCAAGPVAVQVDESGGEESARGIRHLGLCWKAFTPVVAETMCRDAFAIEAHPRVGDGAGAAHQPCRVDDGRRRAHDATITSKPWSARR